MLGDTYLQGNTVSLIFCYSHLMLLKDSLNFFENFPF